MVIKNFINQPEVIAAVATKNNIEYSKIGALQMEVLLTLLGLEYISGFRTNLVQELGITYDQALKITSDINQQIFAPVMETLKQLEADIKNNGGGGNEPTEQAVQISPAPESNKFIPDHEEMLKKEGPHLHSQTVMPAPAATSATAGSSYRKPEPSPQTAHPFKSIVDQKLAGIVRSSSEAVRPANLSPNSQNPQQQNPTAAPKRVTSSDNGYKGNDPYREPIE